MASTIQAYDATQQVSGTQGWGTQTLTDKQQSQVSSILSQYEPSNLTGSDAQSIMQALRKAGIPMGSGLRDAMKADGFDLKQVGSLARQAQQQDQDQQSSDATTSSSSSGSDGINVSALQSLQSILSQYDLSNLSSDQQNSLTSQLQQSGLLQSGNIINLSA